MHSTSHATDCGTGAVPGVPMTQTVRSSPLALTVLGLLHTRPLHPYGIQRLIKQWGKDQVVNVGQRTTGRLAWSEQELLATALGDAQAAQSGK